MDANIECLVGKKIDELALIGRGWWPIKDDKINRRRRLLKGYEELCDIDPTYAKFSLNDRDVEFAGYNWAKSVPFYEDDCDGQTFLIYALKVEDGVVKDVGEFEKDCRDQHCMSFGFGMLEIPRDEDDDEEMPYEMYKLFPDNLQADRMIVEVEKSIAGRCLRKDRSLIGCKLPAACSGGRDSGFSTVRNCYWSFDADAGNGDIGSADFSTYVSHGNASANLFSRPMPAVDHIEDLVYAFLRIVDAYTDEEWSNLMM